jgi:hypothetical protein
MQNVETLSKSHGVDRSKGVAIVILYNLENPCAFEAFERLGIPGAFTHLGSKEGITHVVLNLIRKVDIVALATADPGEWFWWFRSHD